MEVDRAKLMAELDEVTQWQTIRPDVHTLSRLIRLCTAALAILREPEQAANLILADALEHLAKSLRRL